MTTEQPEAPDWVDPPETPESLAQWLDAKYARHKELEDQAAAALIRSQHAEIDRLTAENKQLAEFVIEVGGFWGHSKSLLVGPNSLADCINSTHEIDTAEALLRQAFDALDRLSKAYLVMRIEPPQLGNADYPAMKNAQDAIAAIRALLPVEEGRGG